MKLHGPEIVANSDRLHEIRTRRIEARNGEDGEAPRPDDCQVHIRLHDGRWKPASKIAAGDVIAVRGEAKADGRQVL